jgi:muramidase (phage lysozyme)
MTTRAELQGLLSNQNVQAFLRCIREGESSQGDDAYLRRYHPTQVTYFNSLEKHPRIFELLPDGSGRKSSAAGAYQFTATRWDDLNRIYGLSDDFSRESQDLHAVANLIQCRAMPYILAGDLRGACGEAAHQWASLPGSDLQDGGSKMKWDRFQRVWDEYKGISAEQPAAPIRESVPPISIPESEKKMPAPAFAALAVEALSSLLPTLIRLKSKSPTGEINAQIAEKVLPVIQAAVGATNAQDAVEKIQNDPNAAQTADRAVQAEYYNLVEIGGGVEASRKFWLEATTEGPIWRQIGFGFLLATLALSIILGGGLVMGYVLLKTGTSEATASTILDYYKAIGYIVVGWAFGSSRQSNQKDETIARQAGVGRPA